MVCSADRCATEARWLPRDDLHVRLPQEGGGMRFDEQNLANLQAAKAAVVARRRAVRLEDLNFMTDTGECMTGAARRLGMTYSALNHWCRRHAPEQRVVLLSRDYEGSSSERWAS